MGVKEGTGRITVWGEGKTGKRGRESNRLTASDENRAWRSGEYD